jgi:hypothetical protein
MAQADSNYSENDSTLPAGASSPAPMSDSGAPEKPLQRVPGVNDATRRGLLTILAAGAATVAAGGKVALASPAADPIFALIEEHRVTYLAWVEALKINDGKSPEAEAADEAESELTWAMAQTAPETLGGAVAAIRYVLGYYEGSHDYLQRTRTNDDGATEAYGQYHELFDGEDEFLPFLGSIADCLDRHLEAVA